MKSSWVATVVVLGLGLGAGYWLGQRRVDQDAEARGLQKLERLEQRLTTLERARSNDAQIFRAALATAAARSSEVGAEADGKLPPQGTVEDEDSSEAPEAAPVNTPKRLDPSPQAVRARAEALLSKYDQDSLTPPIEPSWCNPTLRTAEASITSAVPGAHIVEERCGGDTCRLVVEHAVGDGVPLQNRGLLDVPPFDQGSTVTQTPPSGREPARSRLYVHRPDQVALSHE